MESEKELGLETGQDVRKETVKLLNEKGPKLDRVLLRLRQALNNAQETKLVKIKGGVSQAELPKGFDLIASTGLLSHGKDGDIFGDGESLIKCDMIAHGTRLRAIDLALQLHDAMPSKKHDHRGSIKFDAGILNAIISGLPEEFAKSVCKSLEDYISDK